MSHQTDIQAEQDLDASVGDLLTQLQADAARIGPEDDGEHEAGTASPPPPPLPPPGRDDSAAVRNESPTSPSPRLSEMVEESAAMEALKTLDSFESEAGEPAAFAEEPEPVVEPHQPSEPSEPAAEPKAAPRKAEEPLGRQEAIQSLDDELAGIAEDLLDKGDSAENDASAPEFVMAMPAIAALRPEAYRPRSEAQQDFLPAEAPDKEQIKKTKTVAPLVAAPMRRLMAKLRSDACEQVETIVYLVLAAISAPLAARPAAVRNAIGLIAVFNVLLALCVWFYVMFLQPSEPIPPRPSTTSSQQAASPS